MSNFKKQRLEKITFIVGLTQLLIAVFQYISYFAFAESSKLQIFGATTTILSGLFLLYFSKKV